MTGTRFWETLHARRDAIILALMLESLHTAIWVGFGGPLSRSLMLVHLGLFLIWQPIWRGDEKLEWYNIAIFVFLTMTFVTWMNWWLMFGWLVLLIGFCGGRIVISREERRTYMLVLILLAFELLIPCTAGTFRIFLPNNVSRAFALSLPVLPLVIVFLPRFPPQRHLNTVDLLQGVAAATLLTLLAVGSLLNMYRSQAEYLVSLTQTLVTIGIFLLAISWLLTPRLHFSGLSQLWMRSILNIGTPFERWLNEISRLFRQRASPEEFLENAMEELAGLVWIAGVTWSTPGHEGEQGTRTEYETEFRTEKFSVRVFTHTPLGGALYFHCKLLIHIVDDFYVAKIQERELTKRTHLQAIYETGARITHDIKNLLQSLQAITTVILHDDPGAESVSQKLLRRQLPHLTQRLQLALDKLQDPELLRYDEIYLKDWWQDLQNRNNRGNLRFQSDITGDPMVPAELFDSVVENLLENLREKSQLEPKLIVTLTLHGSETTILLSICDNGSAMPDDKARRLFREPLESRSGLGVGLYQAARLAESLEYHLSLAANAPGRVCFELRHEGSLREPAAQPRVAPGA